MKSVLLGPLLFSTSHQGAQGFGPNLVVEVLSKSRRQLPPHSSQRIGRWQQGEEWGVISALSVRQKPLLLCILALVLETYFYSVSAKAES